MLAEAFPEEVKEDSFDDDDSDAETKFHIP